jgi:predicted DNA-binding ribbon-helix-helix protein
MIGNPRRRSRPCYNAAARGKPTKSRKRTKSLVRKWTVVVAGRKTSVCLEPQFFEALKEIATERGTSLPRLVTSIDPDRREPNLSSALRVYVLEHYQNQLAARTPSA